MTDSTQTWLGNECDLTFITYIKFINISGLVEVI